MISPTIKNQLNQQQVQEAGAENAAIVIVGGGPVGLATAIQTYASTGKKVVVIEKYLTYQRTDIRLNIDSDSLTGVASAINRLIEENKLINSPEDTKALQQQMKSWGERAVPISELEGTLAKVANQIGISILRGNAAAPETLKTLFPSANFIIGADGARSQMRQFICKKKDSGPILETSTEYKFQTTHNHLINIQYVAQIKDPEARLKSSKLLIDSYKKQKFCQHVIKETRVTPKDKDGNDINNGTEIVRLQIFVDKETYDAMSQATYGNPYYIETDLEKAPKKLQDVLTLWWGLNNETIITGEKSTEEKNGKVISLNKLTVVQLNSYSARRFYKIDKTNVTTALIGDAAAAFPFFRAVNTGLILSTKLSDAIKSSYNKNGDLVPEKVRSAMKSFSWKASFRVLLERIKAIFKSVFLYFSHFWLTMTNRYSPIGSLNVSDGDMVKAKGASIWEKLKEDLRKKREEDQQPVLVPVKNPEPVKKSDDDSFWNRAIQRLDALVHCKI